MEAYVRTVQQRKAFWGRMFVASILIEAALIGVIYGNLTSFVPDMAIYIVGFTAPLFLILSGVKSVHYINLHRLNSNTIKAGLADRSSFQRRTAPAPQENRNNTAPSREVFDAEIVEDDDPANNLHSSQRLDVSA